MKSSFAIATTMVIGLTIGFFMGRPTSTLSESPPAQADQCNEKLEALKTKFEKLSEVDIQEYIQLKDMKAKYEKADEVFGKILNIFLLDLGLRLSEKQIANLKSAPPPQAHQTANQTSPPEKPEAIESEPAESSKANPIAKENQTQKPNRPDRIESEEDLKKFLDDKSLSSPVETWTSSRNLNRSFLRIINGRFVGQITMLEKDKVPFDVELNLNARLNEGQMVGTLFLLVRRTDGSSASTTRTGPRDTVKHFRLANDGAILVETMGGNGMLQLYHIPQLSSFNGNFYEKRGLGEMIRTGTVVLTRR